MRNIGAVIFFGIIFIFACEGSARAQQNFFDASNPNIRYSGRIDFSDPLKPRYWQPGVTVIARFSGPALTILLDDEVRWGKSHNYVTVVIDNGKPRRLKLKNKSNSLNLSKDLASGEHTVSITKDTEAGVGYVEFKGLLCKELLSPPEEKKHKLEFIGDSITAGMEDDLTEVPCDQGEWYDQHNSWMSYGPLTARALNAEWYVTAVSGIGLIHSCCGMKITMPQVFDKVDPREDSIVWDFKKYQPDAVTICLGQNDGVQDSVQFCSAYVKFIGTIRQQYPRASIICLNSPMANGKLNKTLKNYLTGVVKHVQGLGDARISSFFFSKSFNHGCGGHPDLSDHQQLASELTAYLRKQLNW
jgi:hypothetical protein